MASTPVLATKLFAPARRRQLVARPRVADRLDATLDAGHQLALVSAPAGFGKTTLLGDWVADLDQQSSARVGWLSLDDGDNDLRRFLAHLVAALREAELDVDAAVLDSLPTASATGALTSLINDFAHAGQHQPGKQSVVVLDDYHAIEAPEVHEAVIFLLDHLPDHLHLVMATRSDPPLPLARMRSRGHDVLGTLRTVLFAPEDLALVKGDPGERRRFLDELLVARQPRWSGVRSDYDKILKQRGALLKSAAPVLRRGGRRGARPASEGSDVVAERDSALHTLDVWDSHLAQVGSQLLYARLRLLRDLAPYLGKAYDEVSAGQSDAKVSYKSSLREETAVRIAAGEVPEAEELRTEILASLAEVRGQEVERGVCLVGPHRDDVVLTLGELPAKGYASHGESWSFALGLKLAAYQLLRHDLGDDPVLVLDDVFAELDTGRRERLAAMIADCEQVIITAAVPEDVPSELVGRTYAVTLGSVTERA